MSRVFIPPALRTLTKDTGELEIAGSTVRQIIDALDERFPGLRDRLCEGDELKPGLTVAIDGHLSSVGLMAKVRPRSEIHFLPAIGGG
jgi:sulfur-carrier protein